MAMPESNMFDATAHPIDALALLTWMLRVWDLDPEAGVIVLVMPDDSEALNNRIRVSLSLARKQAKAQGVPLAREFGINSEYFPWTRDDGERRVAVLFRQFMSRRHILKQRFAHSPAFQSFLKGTRT